MSDGGLSKARLGRMHDIMTGYVARGEVPGMVTLVSRRGEVHVDAIGAKTTAGNDPIQRDTIFRISSMTKPITAVAAMILVEECKLRLDEPVDRLLPELANRKVLKRIDGAARRDCSSKPSDHRPRPADLHHGLRPGLCVAGCVSDSEGGERAADRDGGACPIGDACSG
jgi:CubicO group peptidase (beta-lactamase class C family)